MYRHYGVCCLLLLEPFLRIHCWLIFICVVTFHDKIKRGGLSRLNFLEMITITTVTLQTKCFLELFLRQKPPKVIWRDLLNLFLRK
jgi:hypothetical protein